MTELSSTAQAFAFADGMASGEFEAFKDGVLSSTDRNLMLLIC